MAVAQTSYEAAHDQWRSHEFIYYLNLAPTIYCGLKRLTTILGAKFRYHAVEIVLGGDNNGFFTDTGTGRICPGIS